MPRSQISARTRGLGIELRKLRLDADLNTRDAAKKVGIMSSATLNRIELGSKAPTPEEVSALMVVYDVDGLERARLMDLAREAAMPGWWDSKRDTESSKHLNALIDFESTATRIVNVEQAFIPGLMQTPDYTRSLMSSFNVPDQEIERRVAVRVGRQIVLSRPNAPQYLAIIDESALHRQFGDASVMAEQFERIVAVARRQNITVQVVPFTAGGHPGMLGAFSLFEFAKSPTIVYMEHLRSSVFLDKHVDTIVFQDAIDMLRAAALGPADSMDLLASAASGYHRR